MSLGTAFALSAVYVLLSGVLAYFLFRVIAPRDSPATAASTGRRWCAWTIAAATVTMFPRVLHRAFDVDAVALWLVGAAVWGAVAFLVGWAWRTVSSRGNTDMKQETIKVPTPLADTADKPSQSTPTRKQEINQARDEDEVYEQIAAELESGQVQKGLWTRLFAECGGDETRTRVAYIQTRAKQLLAEAVSRAKLATQGELILPEEESTSSVDTRTGSADPELVAAVWGGHWSTSTRL